MAVAVPKCPLCLMGLASAVGLGTLVDSAWLRPLTLAFLGAAVLTLMPVARRRRAYALLFLGALAATLIFVGKFYGGGDRLTYLGIIMLVTVSLWSGRSERGTAAVSSCGCGPEPTPNRPPRALAHGRLRSERPVPR